MSGYGGVTTADSIMVTVEAGQHEQRHDPDVGGIDVRCDDVGDGDGNGGSLGRHDAGIGDDRAHGDGLGQHDDRAASDGG